MRIAVYGNLILDHILELDGPFDPNISNTCIRDYHRAGGIGNFCRAFTLSPALNRRKIEVIPVSAIGVDDSAGILLKEFQRYGINTNFLFDGGPDTSTATIICDNTKRISAVSWGACRTYDNWCPITADWHHFMYLDKMAITPEQLDAFTGIISADVCDGGLIEIAHFMSHLDYIFASIPDEPFSRLLATSVEPLTKKGMIFHNPQQKYFINSDTTQVCCNRLEPNINVLGAGDYFAAHCIADLLQERPLELPKVHDMTLELLLQQTICKQTSSFQLPVMPDAS